MGSNIVVTGAAGFIGSHLAQRLLSGDNTGENTGENIVVGFDNFNDFYDPALKRQNVVELEAIGGDRFRMVEGDLRNAGDVEGLFEAVSGPFTLVHLAAMAGVRPSLEDPLLYQEVNVTGTYRLLEAARKHSLTHYVFGSSSSVYGSSSKLPFSEAEEHLDPLSPYAATKLIGEQIAYVYHVCHGIPATCLRFFTVFGPRQRPEMAIHKFARFILEEREIRLFGDGSTTRDYTFVDDIIDGVIAAMKAPDGCRIYNLGGGHRITLLDMVRGIEEALSKKARLEFVPMHPGDMVHTLADTTLAGKEIGYHPAYPFDRGLESFVDWFTATGKART